MCTQVDVLCFGGTDMFHKAVISGIKKNLKMGAEEYPIQVPGDERGG